MVTPACGGKDGPYLDAPGGALPATLTKLGLFPELATGDRDTVHPKVLAYRPRHELWSNGSQKERFLYLPAGTRVDTKNRDDWQFPVGTMFFKTFSYPVGATSRPVETRVLVKAREADVAMADEGGDEPDPDEPDEDEPDPDEPDEDDLAEDEFEDTSWDYAVYLWNSQGTDADLWDPRRSVAVPVEADGQSFDHVVPAKLDCRKCHESQVNPVIGFDELRLNAPPLSGGSGTQLARLGEEGMLTVRPANPVQISHPDERTTRVLEYLHGNCAHCHNGGDGPSSSFDMRFPVALQNLIGKPTEGEALAGIRVVPGDPDTSALYLAMTREEFEDIQAMPPVGVQRADPQALALIRAWIEALPASNQ